MSTPETTDTKPANEKPKAEPKPKAQPTSAPTGGTAISVRLVKFVNQIDIPGRHFTASITAEPEKRKRWEITYLPQQRHHRITYHPGPDSDPPRTVYVHEHHVATWEPFER